VARLTQGAAESCSARWPAPRIRVCDPFKFGPFGAAEAHSTAADWIEQVRRAEAEGCSTVLVGDHCVSTPACTARLAMAAAVTTTQDAAGSGALG
jgi:alkanesulfonate monooxygenase SsuD/methylene tetrahydromethanopterin reductase-like flavin-dependent oxidoreductase (luciferase family)